MPQKVNDKSSVEPKQPKPLHEARLPVTYAKWKHLQELKVVLEPQYHSFYDNIPHHEEQKKNNFGRRETEKRNGENQKR